MLTSSLPAAEPGKSELRRRTIVGVARDLFLAQGFAATSMSEIAARLGGSKGTLYNYFRSKEELFAAIMIDTCESPANVLFDHMPSIDGDLRPALIELGVGFLTFVLSPPAIAVHRVVAAEADRFPELGRIFYETGPRMGQIKLAAFFETVIEAGKMRACDPSVAARRFKDLVLSDVHHRQIWGVLGELMPEELQLHVADSVDLFLTAFGPVAD